jgi:hypothetical protein
MRRNCLVRLYFSADWLAPGLGSSLGLYFSGSALKAAHRFSLRGLRLAVARCARTNALSAAQTAAAISEAVSNVPINRPIDSYSVARSCTDRTSRSHNRLRDPRAGAEQKRGVHTDVHSDIHSDLDAGAYRAAAQLRRQRHDLQSNRRRDRCLAQCGDRQNPPAWPFVGAARGCERARELPSARAALAGTDAAPSFAARFRQRTTR